jgi:hypothetical protein
MGCHAIKGSSGVRAKAGRRAGDIISKSVGDFVGICKEQLIVPIPPRSRYRGGREPSDRVTHMQVSDPIMAAVRWVRAGGTWVLWTVLAGLLPLWIRVLGVYLHVFADIGWKQVLKEGMLLYFSIAIVVAITTDYHLMGEKYPKYAHIYMMELFPTILWIGSVVIYFLIWTSQLDEITYATSLNVEIGILILSCVYALIHKAIQITRAETHD